MKRIVLILALTAVFASCSTLMGVASLMTCNYDLRSVSDPRLAEISLTSTRDLTSSLDAMSLLRVTTALLSGSVPFSATVNVGATNPNATAAQLSGLDWAIYSGATQMLTGQTAQQIYIGANGGTALIPLTLQIDLGKLFDKNGKDDMLKFANGLLHLGESGSDVSLRIRPSVSFGGQTFQTGFITVARSAQ